MPADAAALLGLVRASRGLHRPWVYPAATPAGIAGWIAGAAAAGRRSFLVCRRGDGGIVGVVNVSEIVRGHFRSAYLGYYAFAPHAGQGYMTEGLGLVLREAFTRLRLHRVEANIQPGNRRSLALVRRLGFRREGFSPRYLEVGGRWRDHERWALLREEWAARRAVGARGRAPGPPAGAAASRGTVSGRPGPTAAVLVRGEARGRQESPARGRVP